MSLAPLQSPYERLNILSNAMNWRGTWVANEQYYQNDVVVSPINNGSYICSVTSLNNAIDPSTDVSWGEVSATSTGVASLIGGVGISVDSSTPNQPIINNEGVLTVGFGTAITVDNTDPQRPIVATTAFSSLIPGNGIAIDTSIPTIPVISNTGVISLTGVGVSISGSPQTPILVNQGVIGLVNGVGINTTNNNDGTYTITNTGVCSLTAGDGIATTGGTNPQIINAGVITVVAADSSITVGGSGQNLTLLATTPKLSILYSANNFLGCPIIIPNYTGSVNFTQPTTPTFLTTTVAAGGLPEHPNACFIFDFSSIIVNIVDPNPIAAGNKLVISYHDSINNKVYSPSVFPNEINLIPTSVSEITPPFSFPLCSGFYDIAEAYTAGIRTITQIFLQNVTNSRLSILYSGSVYATYYPLGVV